MQGGVEVKLPSFLTSAPGSEWLASRHDCGVHCIGGWVGPKAGLNVLENRKTFCPYRDSTAGPSSQERNCYTGYATPAPIIIIIIIIIIINSAQCV
jgi:hypothetical protein